MSGQSAAGGATRRPGRFLRLFFRAPGLLYRIGLGWLMFGQLQITTVGRKSGLPRRTVVDVVGHDDSTDTHFVISAYGDTSDWFRNIHANPAIHVDVRGRRFGAQATVLPKDHAEDVFVEFWQRHRLYVSIMLRLIGMRAGTEEEARSSASEVRIVAIRPVRGES
jgi:deazaflavin-dependent oxidoreductase (nitroreductase family)